MLYDLTTLQQRANQRYGLAASQTLQVAQALYERHKLLSYPRTDARYLTPDQEATLPDIVGGLAGLSVYSSYCERLLDGPITPGKRVINGDEVGDHHAIIPTGKTPRSERLSADEKRVFDLVARRFLAALSPSAVVERTQIVVSLQDVDESQLPEEITMPVRFRAKGTVIVERGWREIDPPKKEREKSLPVIEPGSRADVVAAKAEKGQTKPPRRFNDGTLLKAMEHAGKQLDDAELKRAMRRSGLGTPATRAAILQTLLTRQFLIRKKRDLWSTERGRALIHAVPTPEMKSPELTGRFEARLSRIAEGTEPAEAFMSDGVVQVRDMVLAIGKAEPPAAECTSQPKGPELGVCPVCAKPVRERKAVFACDTGRSCSFVVFRTMARRKISTRMVKALLKNGRSEVVKGFKSRKGKPFSAGLTMKEDGTVGFFFPERASETSKSKPAERKPQALASGELSCPVCHQGRVIRGRTAWGCSRWREGCEARAPLEQKGRALTMDEVLKRLPLGPEGHHSG